MRLKDAGCLGAILLGCMISVHAIANYAESVDSIGVRQKQMLDIKNRPSFSTGVENGVEASQTVVNSQRGQVLEPYPIKQPTTPATDRSQFLRSNRRSGGSTGIFN